ncbi:fatty acid elongase [Yasminevirus sp. GU-2018]|uniref:Fatty acid elongase n=1 Tax=Yasminevirus sp. GU-2018 TaxID=2420051 RepID=A0A5K0UB91_9VIRU|nr:fatty acid elongase [Yasminevirus sp. GU-2018]
MILETACNSTVNVTAPGYAPVHEYAPWLFVHFQKFTDGMMSYFDPFHESTTSYAKSLGLTYDNILMLSIVVYTVLMLSAYYFRRFVTGDTRPQLITEFSTGPAYRPRIGYLAKSVIFSWNMIMAFVSVLILIYSIDVLYFQSSLLGVNPLTSHGSALVAHTRWFEVSDDRLLLRSGGALVTFVLVTKYIEWVDTLINIGVGNSVIFLHFWHHATIFASFSYGQQTPQGAPVLLFNSFIHVVMYLYYALSVIRFMRPFIEPFKIFITVTQIVQFVVGIFFACWSHFWVDPKTVDEFYNPTSYPTDVYLSPKVGNNYYCNVLANMFVISYLVLFLNFFVRSYVTKSRASEKSASGSKQAKTD